MGLIPATGAEITMGRVKQAYTNSIGSNITLSGTLGSQVGHTAGTQISLSSKFGGRTTPFNY
jgi:hypothetical protein